MTRMNVPRLAVAVLSALVLSGCCSDECTDGDERTASDMWQRQETYVRALT